MPDQWKPPAGTEAFVESAAAAGDGPDGVTALVLAGEAFLLGFSEPPPPRLVEGPVTVSCFTPDALHVVKGSLGPAGGDGRFLEVDVADVEHVQRRAEPRADVSLPVSLSSVEGPGPMESVVGRTTNISSGGCRVLTERPFPLGVDPTVTIRIAGREHPVVAEAAILDHDHAGGFWQYRLVFTEIAIDDRARLSRLTRQAQ